MRDLSGDCISFERPVKAGLFFIQFIFIQKMNIYSLTMNNSCANLRAEKRVGGLTTTYCGGSPPFSAFKHNI